MSKFNGSFGVELQFDLREKNFSFRCKKCKSRVRCTGVLNWQFSDSITLCKKKIIKNIFFQSFVFTDTRSIGIAPDAKPYSFTKLNQRKLTARMHHHFEGLSLVTKLFPSPSMRGLCIPEMRNLSNVKILNSRRLHLPLVPSFPKQLWRRWTFYAFIRVAVDLFFLPLSISLQRQHYISWERRISKSTNRAELCAC